MTEPDGLRAPVVTRFPAASLTPRDAARGLWLEQALAADPTAARRERLEADTTADVCIVGGGFTGLWTALELKQRSPGTDVVLIEADICGGGASGRNGGFVMTWWSKFTSLRKLCGTEDALRLAQRAEQAVRDIGAFCEEHEISAGFRPCGWLWTATNVSQVGAWDGTLQSLAAAGVEPFERLSRREVAERSGSPVHLDGVFEPTVATLQPAVLARGLARAAHAAGVRIYEATPMTALAAGECPVVRTPLGEVHAPDVVLAINAWSSRFPQVARGMVVVSSDVVATEPIPHELDEIGWRHGPAVSDSRRLVNYYRTSSDGRVVAGKGGGAVAVSGHMGRAFHGASPRAAEIAAQFRFVYPMLWQAPVDRSWRGPIDYSVTGLPFFCRLESQPHVLVGAGFSGNGVGPAKVAGELLAEMVLDGGDAGLPPALTRAPNPVMPPEPVRYLGARIVRWALAHKEAREDHGARTDPVTALLAGLDPTSFVDRGGPASSVPPSAISRRAGPAGAAGDGAGQTPAQPADLHVGAWGAPAAPSKQSSFETTD